MRAVPAILLLIYVATTALPGALSTTLQPFTRIQIIGGGAPGGDNDYGGPVIIRPTWAGMYTMFSPNGSASHAVQDRLLTVVCHSLCQGVRIGTPRLRAVIAQGVLPTLGSAGCDPAPAWQEDVVELELQGAAAAAWAGAGLRPRCLTANTLRVKVQGGLVDLDGVRAVQAFEVEYGGDLTLVASLPPGASLSLRGSGRANVTLTGGPGPSPMPSSRGGAPPRPVLLGEAYGEMALTLLPSSSALDASRLSVNGHESYLAPV